MMRRQNMKSTDTPARLLLHMCLLMGTISLSVDIAEAQIRFYQQPRSISRETDLGLLSSSPTREVIDLNGTWNYRLDGAEDWKSVSVPSSWEGYARMEFKRTFHVEPRQARRLAFQFVALSISYYCEIRINGQFIGKHAGATTFSIKVSPGIIHAGRNSITIMVHNELNSRETLPLQEQLWDRKNYGGIIHDVAITANQGLWVQESRVDARMSADGRTGRILYQAQLNSGEIAKIPGDTIANPIVFGRSAVEHSFDVLDGMTGSLIATSPAARIIVESDRLLPVELTLSVPGVRAWTPDSPVTYLLRQRTYRGGALVDESYTQIGFRNLDIVGTTFRVNGQDFYLKAVSYVDDSPFHGRSLSLDEMERDVLLIKNLGANAVRIIGGEVHPHFLAMCDRYGLFVLKDIPLWRVPGALLGDHALQATAMNTLREMIARDGSHPSVIAWGLAQGVIGRDPSVARYFRTLAGAMRAPKAQLLYGSFTTPPPEEDLADLDFAAFDIIPQSAERVREQLDIFGSEKYSRPMVLGTLSYPVQIGNYNGYTDPRSIDAQAQFYLEMYNDIRAMNFAGVVVHAFADWSVNRPIMSIDRVHQFTATVGIVDRYRQKRFAYDVLKSRFNREKPPVLVTGNYEEEHPASFVVMGIVLILGFSVVYNVFRRFRENVARSLLRPYNFFSDVRDQRMLSIFQTTVVGLIGSLSAGLVFANLMYYWKTSLFFDSMLSQFVHTIWMKQWLNFAAWNPLPNMLVTGLLLFCLLFLFAGLLRGVAFVFRRKVLMFDAYSVAMWSVLPMTLIAPTGMIMYRLMDVSGLSFILALGYAVIHVWIISRQLKGTAIVFDIRPSFFYAGGVLILGAAAGGWLLSIQDNYRALSYLHSLANVWMFLHGIGS
jgi:beta-galactosidase